MRLAESSVKTRCKSKHNFGFLISFSPAKKKIYPGQWNCGALLLILRKWCYQSCKFVSSRDLQGSTYRSGPWQQKWDYVHDANAGHMNVLPDERWHGANPIGFAWFRAGFSSLVAAGVFYRAFRRTRTRSLSGQLLAELWLWFSSSMILYISWSQPSNGIWYFLLDGHKFNRSTDGNIRAIDRSRSRSKMIDRFDRQTEYTKFSSMYMHIWLCYDQWAKIKPMKRSTWLENSRTRWFVVDN